MYLLAMFRLAICVCDTVGFMQVVPIAMTTSFTKLRIFEDDEREHFLTLAVSAIHDRREKNMRAVTETKEPRE